VYDLSVMIFRKRTIPDEEQEIRTDESSGDFVPLAYFPNVAEAGMVCELLVNNGVRAMLQGAGFGGLEPLLLPGGYSEISLLVAQSDFMRAQELYQAFFARPLRNPLTSVDNQELSDE
jgi:hypothetical protein